MKRVFDYFLKSNGKRETAAAAGENRRGRGGGGDGDGEVFRFGEEFQGNAWSAEEGVDDRGGGGGNRGGEEEEEDEDGGSGGESVDLDSEVRERGFRWGISGERAGFDSSEAL